MEEKEIRIKINERGIASLMPFDFEDLIYEREIVSAIQSLINECNDMCGDIHGSDDDLLDDDHIFRLAIIKQPDYDEEDYDDTPIIIPEKRKWRSKLSKIWQKSNAK